MLIVFSHEQNQCLRSLQTDLGLNLLYFKYLNFVVQRAAERIRKITYAYEVQQNKNNMEIKVARRGLVFRGQTGIGTDAE